MVMALRFNMLAGDGTNHALNNTTFGCIAAARITVFEERAQAVFPEIGFIVMTA